MTILWAILVLLATAGAADAAIFNSPTCQQTDVAVTIGFAGDGDTVTVPASPVGQPCVWTSTLTITKMITLQGAGIGQTVIQDSRPAGPTGCTPGVNCTERWVIRHFNITGGTGLFRITGFTFNADALQLELSDGFIQLSGCTPTTANYRIDHNRFNQLQNNAIVITGSLYGVVDHNDGVMFSSFHLVQANNTSWPRDGVNCTGRWADGSHAFPLTPGTIQAHYIETNTWSGTTSGSIVDANSGGRVVVRNNIITGSTIASHGTDTGDRLRGMRWLESYDNTFVFAQATDFAAWYRGGSGVFYNNTITADLQAGFNWLVKVRDLRSSDFSRTYPPWGFCDGTAVWDGNTGNPGSAGYRCQDQPGSGTSVDYLDTDTPPNIQAQNTLEPIYVWNNTINGAVSNCGNSGCAEGVVIQGVDIIIGTARPGWTPFTYPHPLTLGGAIQPPGTPANLSVSWLDPREVTR